MNTRQAQARRRIAHEAARLMVEHGIRDYRLAKRKAAERCRMGDTRDLPRNDEIEFEREALQRLFRGDEQLRCLEALRRCAVEAMRMFEPFRARLVGSVLSGAVDRHSEVCLHLFSDPPEDVAIFLLENRITHEQGEVRVRFDAGDPVRLPAFRFLAGESPVELIVFSARVRGRVPLSPVDGRPMRRARLAEVEALTEALA